MCKTPVIHMFHTCNTGIYPTHVLSVELCVVPVYILHMYYMCRTTCVVPVHILHMYYV